MVEQNDQQPDKSEQPKTATLGAQAKPNILSFIEFLGITILLCYFVWKFLAGEEKLNYIEIAITVYLTWEFFKRVRQYLSKRKM